MSATLLRSTTYSSSSAAPTSNRLLWTGRIVSGIIALLLALDTAMKLFSVKEAVAGTVQLGFTADQLPIIGMIEVVCLVLYLVPRTAPIGAVLWTGYLGGAIATHVRLHNPLLTHILSPIYVAVLLWGGLYLRDARVRAVVLGTR